MLKFYVVGYGLFISCVFSMLYPMKEPLHEGNAQLLYEAAAQGRLVTLKRLLAHSSPDVINALNVRGRTLLDEAYTHGQSLIVNYLLMQGAQGKCAVFDRDLMIQELLSIKRQQNLLYEKIEDYDDCVALTPELAPELYIFLYTQINAMSYYVARGDEKTYHHLSAVTLYLCCQKCVTGKMAQCDGYIYSQDYTSYDAFFYVHNSQTIIGMGIDALLLFLTLHYKPFCYNPVLAHEFGHYLDYLHGLDPSPCVEADKDSLFAKTIEQEKEYSADSFAHVFVDDIEFLCIDHVSYSLAMSFFSYCYKAHTDFLACDLHRDVSCLFESAVVMIYTFYEFMMSFGDFGLQFLKKMAPDKCFDDMLKEAFSQAFCVTEHEKTITCFFNKDIFSKVLSVVYASMSYDDERKPRPLDIHPCLIERMKHVFTDIVYGDVCRWFLGLKKKYAERDSFHVSLEISLHSNGIFVVPKNNRGSETDLALGGMFDHVVIVVGAETLFDTCLQLRSRKATLQKISYDIEQKIQPYYERFCRGKTYADEAMECYDDVADVDGCPCCSWMF